MPPDRPSRPEPRDQHVALLFHRDRELTLLRQQHRRTQAWLSALHRLSADIGVDQDIADIYSAWCTMMVRELRMQSSAILELDTDKQKATVLAWAGRTSPPVIELPLGTQLPDSTSSSIVCNDAHADPYGDFGQQLGFVRFLCCSVRDPDGHHHVVIGGCDQENLPFSRPFDDLDRVYYDMMAQHMQIVVRNGQLIADLRDERASLARLNAQLERGVEDQSQELATTNAELRDSLTRLRDAQQQLVSLSRQAGMAEIATGVLHNLGNALNGVTVSSELVTESMRQLGVEKVVRAAEVLRNGLNGEGDRRSVDLALEYLLRLGEQLSAEKRHMLSELTLLCGYIEHACAVVMAQQTYAKNLAVREQARVQVLLDDVAQLARGSLHRDEILLEIEAPNEPMSLYTDRNKVLQILFNLVSNARDATVSAGNASHRITLRAYASADNVVFEVQDHGVGIAADMLPRIFTHGFTTKPHGHGFGLHISWLNARELGGELRVHSDGEGLGATFALELPVGTALEVAS